MKRQRLHLVDENNDPLSPAIQSAAEAAHYWAVREFPRIDPALLANWAERLAKTMATRDLQGSVRRYAHTAMHETVRRWLKTKQGSELAVGLDRELDSIAGMQDGFHEKVDRAILFEQLKSRLRGRDRSILMLLQSDATPAEVAMTLGIKYEAATRPSSGSGLEWRCASETHNTRREQLLLDGQITWIGTASHWLWTLTKNKLEVLSAFWNGSRFIVIDIHDNPQNVGNMVSAGIGYLASPAGGAASQQRRRALG